MKHMFDFKSASKEMDELINKPGNLEYFEINPKVLQLKWTDIEVRKYRIKQHKAEPNLTQ